MAFKSAFTIATDPERVAVILQAASAFCLDADAHLKVLALGVDMAQGAYSYAGASAGLVQMALEQVEDTARAIRVAAEQALSAGTPTLRWDVEATVAQFGAVTDIVAQYAQFSDIVILPQPYAAGPGREAEAVLEAALFEGHAPVLILPETGLPSLPIARVVVAWNQSREAMSAIRQALPLLKRALSVNIAVIDPPAQGYERIDPAGALCQMLGRHEVHAEVSVLARDLPRIADVLSRHVVDQDAGLLVMGAYGHSRLREAVMGGATRSMLEQAAVPLFMAH